MKARQLGFNFHELIIVLSISAIVVFCAGWVFTICTANFWYTESGVLRELQADKPQVERLQKSTRKIWDYSEVMVLEGGVQKVYRIDTNLLFNYRFVDSTAP